ncbi:MAG: BTAD domain-containing putative transcriptional regulator [Chloroflexota bacterium]|jgi:predicted ATPase/DNA-binding SARP family transcriptional activator
MREVSLLGMPGVKSTDGPVPRFRSQRTVALLGYLAAERRTITRERLAAQFWPDDQPGKAKANLRRELYNLGQILPGCWQIDRVKVRFEPAADVSIDLDLVQQHEEAEEWLAAAELLRGDFLEGIAVDDNLEFETWLLGEQERWRQRAETILSRAIDLYIQRADSAGALDSARKLLQLTPWNEAVHRQVMLLLARTGQRGAALRQYALCRATLLEDLDAEPSAETTSLYERIKHSQTFAMHNVPAQTMPLIGREQELADLEAWLDDPDVRLITITGAGGMGKTRLSLALAQAEAQAWENPAAGKVRFPDGVYFVRLAPVDDGVQMVFAIARAIHFSISGQEGRSPQQQLFDYLRNKRMLFILDNLEHLLDEVELVTELLRAAPRVQVVATSRARLQLSGEQVLLLNGLAYGGGDVSPAVNLYLESARRTQPDIRFDQEDAVHLDQVCTLVQGMPLALMLAASWSGALSVASIADEIERGLGFLQSTVRDLPARHRSIRAVFESAWLRLLEDERIVYARLSLFVGGFSREAARQVGGASLRLLNRLVNQSLLQYDRQDDRYQLHELLRQYAAGRLAEQPQQELAARKAHLAYFRDLAEKGGPQVFGPDREYWTRRLGQEQGNFAAAINFGRRHNLEAAARLASALWMHWFGQGQLQEAQRLYEPLMARQSELPDSLRAWLMTAYTQMIWPQGEFEKTEQLTKEALGLFENLADDKGMVAAYCQLATVAVYQRNDMQWWQELMELALPYARRGGESWYISTVLQALGMSLLTQGVYDRADEALREALQIAQESGDRSTALYASQQFAEAALMRGDLEEAERLFKRNLVEARDVDEVRIEAFTLTYLGQIATSQGDLPRAIAYLEDAIAFQESAGFRLELTESLISLGVVRLAQDEHELAGTAYRRAALIAQAMARLEVMARCLEGLAQVAWESGPGAEAPLRWLATADAWRTASETSRLPADQARYETLLAQIEDHFPAERFSQIWAQGQDLAVDEALAQALS